MKNMQLDFGHLFKEALKDWPAEIDVIELAVNKGNPIRYSIEGLYELYDDIASKYIGTSEEVMLRNLHDAIYEVLHTASAYITHIKMTELRPQPIRLVFERRITSVLEEKDLGWQIDDIDKVKLYFAQNS